ncbi:MAG: LysM peptidoglycan-binding domain-containing protein [Firmicutes bacterium]|nr:LysM peptidoglycan-binding domain-containing protein [Bacillota bacterium]
MNKSENVSRTLIAAVAILAVLSLAGNALVIWYIKQTAPKPYDDSILAMRIGRIEDEIAGVGALVSGSQEDAAVLGTRLDELAASLSELVARDDPAVTIAEIAASTAQLQERAAAVEGALLVLSDRTQAAASSQQAEFDELAAGIHQLSALKEDIAALHTPLGELKGGVAALAEVPAVVSRLAEREDMAGSIAELVESAARLEERVRILEESLLAISYQTESIAERTAAAESYQKTEFTALSGQVRELGEFRQDLSELRSQLAELSDAVAVLAEMPDVVGELAAREDPAHRIAQLETAAEKLQQRTTTIEEGLLELSRQTERIAASAEAVESAQKEEFDALASRVETISGYKEDIALLQSQLGELAAAVAALAEVPEVVAELAEREDPTTGLTELAASVARLEARVAALEDALAVQTQQLTAVREDKSTIEMLLNELNDALFVLAGIPDAIVDLAERLDDTTRIDQLLASSAAIQEKVVLLEETLAVVSTQTKSIAELSGALESSLMAELKELASQVQQLASADDAAALEVQLRELVELLSSFTEQALIQHENAVPEVDESLSSAAELAEKIAVLEQALLVLAAQTEAVSERTEAVETSIQVELTELASQLRQLAALLEQDDAPQPELVLSVFGGGRPLERVDGGVRLGVIPGDTIWDLARRFSFKNPPPKQLIQDILDLNGIADPRKLQVGQSLFIPLR